MSSIFQKAIKTEKKTSGKGNFIRDKAPVSSEINLLINHKPNLLSASEF